MSHWLELAGAAIGGLTAGSLLNLALRRLAQDDEDVPPQHRRRSDP